MPSFAAPNMTAAGAIGGPSNWDVGQLPIGFAPGQAFSIEAWVYPGGSASYGTVVVKANEFGFGLSNGYVYFGWAAGVYGGETYTGATLLQPQTWTHIAATYDGTNLTLYVDGAPDLQASLPGGGSPSTGSDLLIGAIGTNSPLWVWSTTLYDYARSTQQEADAPWVDILPSPGLVANFDFSVAPPQETISGQTMTPQSGAVSQTFAPVVAFDGQYSGMLIGQPAPSVISAPFSASAWISLGTLPPAPGCVFASGDLQTDLGAFALLVTPTSTPNTVSLSGLLAGNQVVAAVVSINPGDWHNVAVTYDGTNITLYLDGQQVGQTSASAGAYGPPLWTAGFAVVNRNKTCWFSGQMQWLSCWSRCLSPDEVVYQQYGSVSADPTIIFDISLDGAPPADIANLWEVDLAGTAAQTMQIITVTQWSPPPEQQNPSDLSEVEGPRRLDSVNWPTPTGPFILRTPVLEVDEQLKLVHALSEKHLAKLEPGAAALFRNLITRRVHEAAEAARSDPAEFQPVQWRRDGQEQVFIYKHPVDGPTELLRVPADAITACQMWWLSFTVTLLAGVLNLLFISFRGQDLYEWIQRRVLDNQTVLEALQSAWNAQPGFTGFTVIKLLAAFYNLGLLRSFLWFCAYKAGWYGLFRLFSYCLSFILTSGGTALLFATNALVLATQLGLQVAGGPNVPGYSSSCGSGVGRPAEKTGRGVGAIPVPV
jgi:hypothetical protein